MTPQERFPELADFELEMESQSGCWSIFRADEDERAAAILDNADQVRYMLSGGYAITVRGKERTRFRLTPKSWFQRPAQTV